MTRWIVFRAAGVGTLVGMHYSEEYRKRAEELKINLVVAGHISSDVLGMNLVLDAIEREGEVRIICTSGMVRVSRQYDATALLSRSVRQPVAAQAEASGRAEPPSAASSSARRFAVPWTPG